MSTAAEDIQLCSCISARLDCEPACEFSPPLNASDRGQRPVQPWVGGAPCLAPCLCACTAPPLILLRILRSADHAVSLVASLDIPFRRAFKIQVVLALHAVVLGLQSSPQSARPLARCCARTSLRYLRAAACVCLVLPFIELAEYWTFAALACCDNLFDVQSLWKRFPQSRAFVSGHRKLISSQRSRRIGRR